MRRQVREALQSDHPLRRWRLDHNLSMRRLGLLASVSWKVIQTIETKGTGCHIDTACDLIEVVQTLGGGLDYQDLRYNPR